MNHSQQVVVNGSVSESTTVISGVPQGSVLGPLLFLIYINSIPSVPLTEESKISPYANDMMLYKQITSSSDITVVSWGLLVTDVSQLLTTYT